MEIVAAAVLGIVQGLTELLPVSSSAHLILVPWLLGWQPEGLFFDVSLHVGTAIAILAYFWKDWITLAGEVVRGIAEGKPLGNSQRKLAWFLVVGTLPAMAAGLMLESTAEKALRSPLITVFTLIIFGALLYFSDRSGKKNRNMEDYTWADSIWIGFSQAVALIPGVSRSGITISTAMLRNSSRAAAARFSFLLSAPIVAGAGLLEGARFIRALRHPLMGAGTGAGPIEMKWGVVLVGMICAAISGFLCIRYFLRYIQKNSYMPFVIYRFILAIVVLMFYIQQK